MIDLVCVQVEPVAERCAPGEQKRRNGELAEPKMTSRDSSNRIRNATAPVPFTNVFLHLGDHPAKCSDRLPVRFKVVRDLLGALVSQIKVTFRD